MVAPRPTRPDLDPVPTSTDEAPKNQPRIIYSEATRAWLYRIALAVLVLAGALHWIPLGISDEITGVISAVLGIGSAGLAAANTSTGKPT